MILILWEYKVAPSRAPAFIKAYGSNGVWTGLFRRDAAYLGTELIRNGKDPHVYRTIDRWESLGDYNRFRAANEREYADLDATCRELYCDEDLLPYFEVVG